MPYSNVPEELTGKMDRCVNDVMKDGVPKRSAIAICYDSIMGKKAVVVGSFVTTHNLQTDHPPSILSGDALCAAKGCDHLANWRVNIKGEHFDYCSVDLYGDDSYPTHHVLLNGNVIILESINLAEVREGDYTLIALPLKIKGAEASPVRAVLAR